MDGDDARDPRPAGHDAPIRGGRPRYLLVVLLLVLAAAALAAAPVGYLDAADGEHIAGWASDPDWAGAIAVHVYVDGVLMRGLAAGDYRADVGSHAFDWDHEPFGAGEHDVVVYAIGVDATGSPDGNNPSLTGSPAAVDVGCAGLAGDPRAWCDGNPGYWRKRQDETVYLGDDTIRVGLSPSYGGTVFQLYDDDWTKNLLMEHGGAAIQLSIWGYDPVGGTGWFALDACDATPFASDADCRAAGHASCVARAFSDGDHIADCRRVEACVGWDAGAPWNPIMAQGADCAWDSAANDAASEGWVGSAYRTEQEAPRHFTKTGDGVAGLSFGQLVTAEDGAMRLDYTMRYTGTRTWSDHDQEIPALFTAHGVDERFYWYEGDAPFADTTSAVSSASAPIAAALAFPGVDPVTSLPIAGTASERWWSACDNSDDRCVTVVTFAPSVLHATLSATAGKGAYLTPMGNFNLYPGFDETWTVWVFPYRYDDVVGGRTVRAAIHEIAADAGCTAEIDCNGVDEDCTGEDRCVGEDSGNVDTGGGADTDTGTPGGGDSAAEDSGDGELPADLSGGHGGPPGNASVLDRDGCGCASGAGPRATGLAFAGIAVAVGAARRRRRSLA